MHVLATELATLDEADVAVDLGQSPADVVVLSFSDTDLSALAVAWPRSNANAASMARPSRIAGRTMAVFITMPAIEPSTSSPATCRK